VPIRVPLIAFQKASVGAQILSPVDRRLPAIAKDAGQVGRLEPGAALAVDDREVHTLEGQVGREMMGHSGVLG